MIPATQAIKEVSTLIAREILIVDDSPPVTRALAKLLSSRGLKPLVCMNATEALALSEQSTPAAAVIDIHLPDMSGLVLTQRLRARFGESTPIIVVSGDHSPEVLNSLSLMGATYFFSKPVSVKILVEKIEGLLPKL